MAYGIKYQLYCKGRDGITTKLVISEDGYAGPEIDRNVPVSPFILRKDSATVIQGTSLEFRIREKNDFEFLSFYTNNPKKFKTELYRAGVGLKADSTSVTADDTTHTADEEGGSTRIWIGFLNPQQYSCKYISGGQDISFQATDSLGLLKSESFTLTGFRSEFQQIRYCVDKIGLNLEYAIAIGLHVRNHNKNYPAITQSYSDCGVYTGMNCYEVLEAILIKYDATITQWGNRWCIVSYKDKKMDRFFYSWEGVYQGIEAAPPVILLDLVESAQHARPSGYLNMKLQPGGKKVFIKHDYGRKDSFLKNHDFAEYSNLMFNDWIKSGTFTPTRLSVNDGHAAYLSGYSNVDTDFIEQSIAVTNVVGQGFVFEIKAASVGHVVSSYSLSSLQMEVRIQVTINVSDTVYYLTSTGWSTTPGYVSETITSAIFPAGITFYPIKIVALGLPGSGILNIRLMRYKHAPAGSGIVFSGVAFSDVKVYFLKNGELYPCEFSETAVFPESSEPGTLPGITIVAADAPNEYNASLLYKNILILNNGLNTSSWVIAEDPYVEYTLIGAYLKCLASRNRVARQVLTGTIKGAALGFDTLIRHEYNSNREFEIFECSWDIYEGKWNITLIEWLPFINRRVEYE